MNEDEALDRLDELFQCLDERERKIIFWRFGLNGEKEKTLEAVGKELGGLSRERVRQMQNIALSKLRRVLNEREKALDADLQWKPNLPVPPQETFVEHEWPPERRKKHSERMKKAWAERKAEEKKWREEGLLPQPLYQVRPILWYDCKIPLNALRLTINRYQQ